MHVLSTRLPLDHGHRTASCDTSLVVSGGVDCQRRQRNVYDKKPQRYAKDNRTVHFCTVEANYWQTRSIARPLRDSWATCLSPCATTSLHMRKPTVTVVPRPQKFPNRNTRGFTFPTGAGQTPTQWSLLITSRQQQMYWSHRGYFY